MAYFLQTDDYKTILDVDRLLADLESENHIADSSMEFIFQMDDSDTEFIDTPATVIETLIDEAQNYTRVDALKFEHSASCDWNVIEDDLMFNAEVPLCVRIALLPIAHGGCLQPSKNQQVYIDYTRNIIQDTIRLYIETAHYNNAELADSHLAILEHLSAHSVQTISLKKYLEGNGAVLKAKLQKLDVTDTERCKRLVGVLLRLEDYRTSSDSLWASTADSHRNHEANQAFYRSIFPFSSNSYFKIENTPPSLTCSPCSSIGSLSSNDSDTTRSSISASPSNKNTTHSLYDTQNRGNLLIKPIPMTITTPPQKDFPAGPQQTPLISIIQKQSGQQPLISSSRNSFTLFNSLETNKLKLDSNQQPKLKLLINKQKSMPCI